eukprot:7726705-Prorocentrum_lima.AAC.1
MTSSLVGSEMCIRDSQNVHALLLRLGHGRGKGNLQVPGGALRNRGCCLLYTSDAADECRSRWS